MLKKVEDLSAPESKGLNTVPNILSLQRNQTPNCMDVKINYDGSIEERLGTNTQNTVIIAASAAAGFGTNSTGTLTTALLSFWKMDEASGNRADAFGTVTLVDSGSTLFSSGIKNQAALFNAATQQALSAVNPPTLTANTSFTISSWVYLNSTSGTLQRTLTSKRDQGASGVSLLLHCDGTQASSAFTDNSLNNTTITANSGATMDTAQKQFGSASFVTTGGNAFLTTTSMNNNYAFGIGDFTIDFWFRSTAGPTNGGYWFSYGTTNGDVALQYVNNTIAMFINGVQLVSPTVTLSNNLWQHIAVTRQGSTFRYFVDGTLKGNDTNSASIGSNNTVFSIGLYRTAINPINGWIDEFRVIKGTASYTGNFTPPTAAYANPQGATEIEHWLYVDTNNQATFDVSSSGTVANGSVTATSFGALTTSTWYNVVAWVNNSANNIGISVNLSVNTASYSSGMLTGSAPYTIGAISNGAAFFMDGRIDETGYWNKVLTAGERVDLYNTGLGNTYSKAFDTQPWGCFDFGASATRWLIAGAGTGVYASSNLGVTWVNIATDRTATYQYFDRSKNVLIATSDNYDNPLFWAGSGSTFMAVVNSNAPLAKYSVNFQGYCIMLNTSARKRGFFFEDENTQLTGTWSTNFDIPSSADDEITSAFVLRRYLYISTRYKLFRISFVGGNPVWQTTELKNWGFVSRTPKRIIISNNQPGIGLYYSIGEVAVGLGWDRKLRIFDGTNDQIISNPIEFDNGQCDFSLNKISYTGSGPLITFAESDPNQNIYSLCVAIGANSTATTHFINYDARALAFYPWSNMNYNCMCMAESANQRFLMAFDRSGYCHMMNSGNLDSNKTAINGLYDSPFLFEKSPSQSTKGHQTDLFYSNLTCGTIIYSERVDGNNVFTERRRFTISGSAPKVFHYETIDIPETYNFYQFRITHVAGGSQYRILRWDHFAAPLGIGKND